jgi:hypothetical protein
VRLLLKRLQATSAELSSEQRELIDDTGIERCAATVTALSTLVKETQQKSSGPRSELWAALRWLISKSDAEKLVDKMELHMRDLSVSFSVDKSVCAICEYSKAFTNRWNHSEVTAKIRDDGIRTRNYPKPRAHGSRPESGRDGPDSDGTSALSCAVSTSTTGKEATSVVRPGSDAGRPIFLVAANVLRRRVFRGLEVLLNLLEEAEQVHRQWWINCACPGTYSPQENRIRRTKVG